jgi:capsular polysaccharide biosynthesis protein
LFPFAPTQRDMGTDLLLGEMGADLLLGEDKSPRDAALLSDGPSYATNGSASDLSFGDPMQLPGHGLFSLRLLKSALRRQRRLWLGAAVAGLAIGGLYHTIVPLKYWATSTVYIADPANSSPTVTAQDDLAILQTNAVADRALAQLREPGLTAAGLLGKLPGTLMSPNVLEISVSGPSPQVAVRRVDALADAFLSFQAKQYDQANRALVTATTKELAKLHSEVKSLSTRIGSASRSTGGKVLLLEAQKTALLTQIANLDAAIQQDNLNQLAVTNGSKVLSRGAIVPGSVMKVLLRDGLTGLVAGMGLGIISVVVFEMLSDRVRRREDVAEILNAPVTLNVGRVTRRWPRELQAARMVASPTRELQSLARGLRSQLRLRESCLLEMVVAMDDTQAPAAALMMLAAKMASLGKRTVLVDLTDRRALGRALGCQALGAHDVSLGGQPSTLVVPRLPKQGRDPGGWNDVRQLSPDVALMLATVDPAVGASHLKDWNSEAVVTVSAGRSSVQRVAATAELLHAAGILITSAALLDADPKDDSVGLPSPHATPSRRSVGAVQAPEPAVT